MLNLDTHQVMQVSLGDLIGERIAILGISGSGKTNTVSTLAEELLPSLPMTIVDPEGEYYGLKERFEILVAGRSEHAEVPLFVENAPSIAEISLQRGISVILDMSEYDSDEMQDILTAYFKHLWKVASSRKVPYEIILEEAHEFLPQGMRTPLKELLTRFAVRGRKRGIGIILASQRSAKVEKDALTQAGLLFLHQVVHPTDLSVYKDLIPLPARQIEEQVRALARGEAFVVRGKEVEVVHMRVRSTYHAGATPTLGVSEPSLKTIDGALLKELREITQRSVKEGGSDEVSKLKKMLKDAEQTIREQQTLIEQLTEHVNLLAKLTVQMNGNLSLPSTLAIDRADVHQMHTPLALMGLPPAQVAETSVTPKKITASPPSVSASEHMPPLNEEKFASLHRRVHQASAFEVQVLSLLAEHESSMTVKEIAAWVNRPELYVQNRPPKLFMRMQLIERIQAVHGYRYRSTIRPYLEVEFPGADSDQLQKRLLRKEYRPAR